MSDLRRRAGRLARQVLGEEQMATLRRLVGQDRPPSRLDELVGSVRRLMDHSRDLLANTPEPGPDAPRVLIYAANGRALTNFFEGMLAHALRLRGVEPLVLFCDQFFEDYCDARYVSTREPDRACDRCFQRATALFDAYEVPVLHFSQFAAPVDYDALLQQWLAEEARTPLLDVTYKDIKIGHLAYSSTLHYLLIGSFDLADAQTRHVFLRLLRHTARLVDVLEAALERYRPDVVLQTHSLYILWGTMAEVCRKHNQTFYDYFFGYRANTLVFGKQDAYQWALIKEPTDHWQKVPLSPAQEARIRDYMTHRELGDRDDLAYFRDRPQTPEQVRDLLKLDPNRPIIGAFPNLGWDGAVLFRDSAFDHLFDWAVQLVRFAGQHPHLQLVIRSHPAEVQQANASRERVEEVIRRHFPELPENVRVIGPEDALNSYALVPLLDAATVYTSKIGFELAYRGIPVVVAGMAFFRNRGFTFDASTPEEYFAYLADVERLKAIHQREGYSELAMRFSYYFFFQKYIDVSFVRWKYQQDLTLNIASLAEIRPGANRSMDVICDILLRDRPTYLTLEESEALYAENQVAALSAGG